MDKTPLGIPQGYHLERDADAWVLRRSGGAMVAAFSALGARPEAVRQAAEDDARGTLTADPPTGPAQTTRPDRTALRARFFGDFEVIRGGEMLPLGRCAKAVSILKYLLVHRDRPVSRDHLMGWLWPESNLRKARWSLNSAVSALRKLLDDHAGPVAPARHILLEDGRYRLSPAVEVSSDVDEFDAHRERGLRLDKEQRAAEAAAEYGKAAALYRDDFLVGDLYEDWTMVERERLLSAYVETLCWLAEHHARTGEHRESVGFCFGLLKKEPCHERAYRLLMDCYARLGFPTLALRQYELCESALRLRLGLDPSPETRALHRDISGREIAEVGLGHRDSAFGIG